MARSALDAVDILEVAGFDPILIETVGVGQDEVEVARASPTTIVVSAPGLGDDIQALKAGLLETADVHVVNKADREGADHTVAELRAVQALATRTGWQPPVLATCAESGDGVAEVADALDTHHRWLLDSGQIEHRGRAIAVHRLKTLLTDLIHERVDRPTPGSAFAAAVDALHRRTVDPWSAARSLLDVEHPTKGSV
jgi:LAO/AO transport system kinase